MYERLGQEALSTRVLRQQLLYLQKVTTLPMEAPQRRATFHGSGLVPITSAYVGRVGRPRNTWAEQLLGRASEIFGSRSRMERALLNSSEWRRTVLSTDL